MAHLTKAEKIANYDAMERERDLLRIAVYDLRCASKFKFSKPVIVDCASEIDSQYSDRFRISVSSRSMPYYMVESMFKAHGYKVTAVQFVDECELDAHRDSPYIFWRAVRHGAWKLSRAAELVARSEAS